VEVWRYNGVTATEVLLPSFEHLAEALEAWGVPLSDLPKWQRVFTVVPSIGVNVNTAPKEVVEGLVTWQSAAVRAHPELTAAVSPRQRGFEWEDKRARHLSPWFQYHKITQAGQPFDLVSGTLQGEN